MKRLRLCLALAALALLTFAGASYGQATPGKFTVYVPLPSGITDVPCIAGTGFFTGTETQVGEFIPTPQGIHYHITATVDYRIDFPDGSYLVSSSPAHVVFNQTGSGAAVSTEVQQDRATLYSADGQAVGILSVFSLTHTTWIDANGNGFPDPGEIKADVSQFRATCP
jgi:hypothetical protein